MDGFRRKMGVTFVNKHKLYVAAQMQDDHYKCRENYSRNERLSMSTHENETLSRKQVVVTKIN